MTDAGVTDVLLTGVAAGAAYALFRSGHREGAIGLVLVGAASTLGSVRFLGVPDVAPVHQAATRLAGVLGIPLLGLGWLIATVPAVRARRGLLFRLLAVVAIVASPTPLAPTVLGGAGMLAVLGAAARSGDPAATALGWVGAAGVLVSGLAIAGEGAWLGVSRLAWFHVALAASLASLAGGLSRCPRS